MSAERVDTESVHQRGTYGPHEAHKHEWLVVTIDFEDGGPVRELTCRVCNVVWFA